MSDRIPAILEREPMLEALRRIPNLTGDEFDVACMRLGRADAP